MPAPAAAPAAPARQPWPSWKQVMVMFGGGFLLALSGCFGMIVSFDMGGYQDYETVMMAVTSIVFLIGLLAFLIGIVMFLMKILRLLFASSSAQKAAAQSPDPGGPS
jgi:small-conductance mechanosensitive channel